MTIADRFQNALQRIDDANRADPRTDVVDGAAQPRELAFSLRAYQWVCRLVSEPSEALRLAARAHTLRRWMIPRESYPKTNVGYHIWRSTLADFHADEAARILTEVGYTESTVQRVRALILKRDWLNDPEGRALEDAGCLAFLELKLAGYVDEWGEQKTLDILRRTLRKMTPAAIEFASGLPLDPRSADLLRRASTSSS